MRILTGQEIFRKNFEGSVVTIGNFDGVHRGHAEIFRHLNLTARRMGLPSVVVTFDPHPLAVLAPELAPPLITTFDQKVGLIAEADIDNLAVIEFTRQFAQLSAADFVHEILCHSLGMRHIIIGHDYAFGRNREGNYATLEHLGDEYGFTLEDLKPVGDGSAIFSSSLVRRLIAAGDMVGASLVLGRYHVVSGEVVHGREIGQKLGFPTANITPRNELIPPDGVYAVLVAVGDRVFQGACNIGTNPTFDGQQRTIEVFLLDFSGDLYGCELSLCFVQRLRDVKKFSGAGALIEAINLDVAASKTILSSVSRKLVKPMLRDAMCGKGAA